MDRAFQVGDRVWGLYRNGRWYPATIAEARGDGRFVLSWDDGDTQDRVKEPADIRPLTARTATNLSAPAGAGAAVQAGSGNDRAQGPLAPGICSIQ